MERFLKRKTPMPDCNNNGEPSSGNNLRTNIPSTPAYVDLNNLPFDPAERKRILLYHPDQRDEIRRMYLIKGPCQPRGHDFPRRIIGNKPRRFNPAWFDQYNNWLEYSIKADKAFCLPCYLFRDQCGGQGGSDVFLTEGFSSWNKSERLVTHVGHINSFHNRAVKKGRDLTREKQSIAVALNRQSDIQDKEYRIRLNASVVAARYLANGSLPFCGNEELSLGRPRDTRWGSHYKTLKRLVDLFPSIIEVLKYVEDMGKDPYSQRQANGIQDILQSFDTVFYLHLMLHILGITESLSQALQKKDQDILNAVSLVKSTKRLLQQFRLDGFDPLIEKIYLFCEKHNIETVMMEEIYIKSKSGRRNKTNITSRHYFECECFNTVVDMQIQEFGDRFDEVSSELLICMAALDPHHLFCDFNPSNLVRLAEFYPNDFTNCERTSLEHQLQLYIDNVKHDELFANLKGISELGRVMVETRKHLCFLWFIDY